MPTVNMAVTRSPHVAGGLRIVVGNYSGPASYVAGGDALGPGDVGLGDIEFIDFSPAAGGQTIAYNYTTGKAQWLAAGAEVAGGTVLNAQTVRFMAIGK